MMRALLSALLALLLTTPGVHAQEKPLPREVTVNGVEFVLIPEGWFWYTVFALDIVQHNDERPRYRNAKVWLDSYYLAKYEARARDLARFMNSGAVPQQALAGRAEHRELMKDGGQLEDFDCTIRRRDDGSYVVAEPGRDLPAVNLTWTLADAFARWMGFRLPSEAEWQKAARGPDDQRIWPWGNEHPDDTHAVFGWSQGCHPSPVDTYPKGRSPYGIYQMAGNASEYVADWYNQQFDDAIRDGARNPGLASGGSDVPWEGAMKMSKGGRWSQEAVGLAIANRRLARLHGWNSREGVRFAVDTATVRQHLNSGTATVTKP